MLQNINSKLTKYVEKEQIRKSYNHDVNDEYVWLDDDVTHLFLEKSRNHDPKPSTEERKYSATNSISTRKRQANTGWNRIFEVNITLESTCIVCISGDISVLLFFTCCSF